MEIQVSPAKTAGELNGANEHGRDGGEGVRNQEEAPGEHAVMGGIFGVECDGQVVEEDDGQAQDGKDAPKREF